MDVCKRRSVIEGQEDRAGSDSEEIFRKSWAAITDPNPLTLFGFRRFRTSHLLNIRALELEILDIDHHIFQAGLGLGEMHGDRDRLALTHAIRDPEAVRKNNPKIDESLLTRLRTLLQQYGMCSTCQFFVVFDRLQGMC